MAIDAKVDFILQIEKELSETVTAADMGRILSAVKNVLQGYEMRSLMGQADDNDDLLQSFLDALAVVCRSAKTIERYRYVIGRLMKEVQVPTRQVTVYHLRAFLQREKERGVQESTLEGYRLVFSAYFNWLQRENLIDRNPVANLGTIKVAKKEKKIYSETDIEKLVRAAKTARDRAMIHFMASTGCRISEMVGLNRNAINLASLECVVHGKGNKERTVYMSQIAGWLLNEYLHTRTDDCPALFAGKGGVRLQPSGVRAMLKKLAEETGVDHVHPHKFRRTLATELTRRGMPVQEVAKILGHEKLDTTMGYLVLNNDSVRSRYRRFS